MRGGWRRTSGPLVASRRQHRRIEVWLCACRALFTPEKVERSVPNPPPPLASPLARSGFLPYAESGPREPERTTMRDRLAKEWPPIPPRRGIQSIDARRTSSQQHQFQELSQPQNSRTNELNCPLRHLHPRSNNNDDDSPTMMMRGGWRRNPFAKIVWKSSG